MGGDRVRADLRRVPAARRPGRRPARPQAHVHGRAGLFTAASLACALATTDTFLIIMRGIQGLGAAVVLPAALSIVMNMFPEGAERNKALGHLGRHRRQRGDRRRAGRRCRSPGTRAGSTSST